MSAPLPSAFRTRFQRYIQDGLSGRAAALRQKLSPSTVARWARQVRRRGHAKPAPNGPPRGKGKLAAHQAFLEELIAQDPDMTLFELRDALASHRNKKTAQALRDNGCRFLYLPEYSLDLNPIEQAYSKLKDHLRQFGARAFTEVFQTIGSICDHYDPEECWNYFKTAGYVASLSGTWSSGSRHFANP